ncbi:MAG TPA: M1 family aminopeptidase [Thermoanaerobaculia bacterium]|nr:M1 family aminopeptidase [Thermoanaerobaculia bacterium]
MISLFVFAAAVTTGIEPWALDRLDLDLHLTLDPPALTMTGKAKVRALADSDGPAFGLNDDDARVMTMQSLRAGGVEAVIAPFAEGSSIEVARLQLPEPVKAGATLEVEFTATSRDRSSQFIIGKAAAYGSWVESWYPRPAIAEKALASPAAPGTTTLRMPRGWRSVAPGVLVSRSEAGDEVVEVWETTRPAARSFAAAPFVVHDTIEAEGHEIGVFLLKERPAVRAQAVALAKSVAAMERHFGPFPYPSFHIVELPEALPFAAASEQGFIVVRASLLDAEAGNLPLFAHEAAHAWWGNLVRTDGPGGKMLSEAAAQYGAVISIEAVEGEAAARRFLRYSREGYSPTQSALGYFYIWRQGGDKPLSQLESDRWDHNLADAKGHWFYRMVRNRIGDEAFFTALRSILRDFAGERATVADLRRAFLNVSDDPALPQFLEQWLDRTGAPVLNVDWWSADRGRAAEIHIEQLQSGEPYQLPLELAIDLDDGEVLLTTVQLCERKQRFFIATPVRPVGVRLDPQDKVLLWRPEYGSRPE